MMIPLAKHLARSGITSYAIDLPGHGASPLRFSGPSYLGGLSSRAPRSILVMTAA
jgi:alpha-beta hydrolase superfamily lysophospholipase